MKDVNIALKIERGLHEIFPELNGKSVDADTLLGEIPEWDSMAAVNLMVFIEEAFAVEMPEDFLNSETSIGEIVNLIRG